VRYIEWLYYYFFLSLSLSLSPFRRPRLTPLLANPDFIFATLRLKQLHTHIQAYASYDKKTIIHIKAPRPEIISSCETLIMFYDCVHAHTKNGTVVFEIIHHIILFYFANFGYCSKCRRRHRRHRLRSSRVCDLIRAMSERTLNDVATVSPGDPRPTLVKT